MARCRGVRGSGLRPPPGTRRTGGARLRRCLRRGLNGARGLHGRQARL